ncbi:DEAD/DEAH box helicase [Humibacter sp.]|uniref:DEAD/DEAH box helicase n=1 Tax=Humibacter sp. TaxID=1940291 RepID=UPI003F80FBE3
MPGPAFPIVEPSVIRSYVGEAAFARADAYANTAVLQLRWKLGMLEATIAGSEPQPYDTWVTLVPASGGRYRPTASGCSCPVSTRCKHVAAAMLAARETQLRADAVAPDDGPGWRSAVRTLAAEPPREYTPLALIVEVRERMQNRTGGRWNRVTETARAATRESTGRIEITARIGAPGKRGWVGAQLSWGSLQYRTHELGYDPAQVRWFLEFETLARAAPGRYFQVENNRLDLAEFSSPLLWRLFADARERGIPVVAGNKNGSVGFAERAHVVVDAAERDGGLVLVPSILVDGSPVDASAVRTIGDHGIIVLEWPSARDTGIESGPVVTLAPTDRPISGAVLSALRRGAIQVPAAEVAEFEREAYPQLARSVEVRAVDASIRLPELSPPLLVLTVEFRARQTVTLGWSWEYRFGVEATRFGATVGESDRGRRDLEAEADVLAALTEAAPMAVVDDRLLVDRTMSGVDAAEWVAHVLPALEALVSADGAGGAQNPGLRVDIVGERVDYQELTDRPELTVTTVPTDQRDWFDLGVLVTVQGRQIPFLPLFHALATGKKKLLLVDHSYLSLNQPVFDRLKDLLVEAEGLAEWETGPRISRYQASLWEDFEDLADQSMPAVEWRKTVAGLLASPGDATDVVTAAPLPTGLQAELRPYQRAGYDWLVFLWEHGLGGVLADDMGLGKTLQTLALIQRAREEGADGPFLVVAPASVVANWASEAARFTPGLRVASVTATRRKERTSLSDVVAGADIVLTTYTVFRLDHEEFTAQKWAGLVLDEAQFVKNHASQTHRLAREVDAPFRLAVTGTPLENNLLELWAMFQIVAPGLFPSRRRFVEEYVKPIAAAASPVHGTDEEHGAARLERLRRRIRPLMLRRTKDVVAPELPEKQEQVLSIPLAPKHRALYDTWLQRERQKVLGLLDDLNRQRFIVYRSITLLRMLAVDASLIDPANEGVPSTKLDALLDQLSDVLAEGHRALVFSQFTSYLAKVAARLDAAGIRHSYLDGSTRRRADVIRRFREGDDPVFLISLKAGGFGLTLTEADYVFLLDPWWNPAAEAQAIDRTHRIGQTKQVMVYRMVASDTIEEKVMRLARRKGELFDAVLDDDGAFSSALSADDIRALLE